MHWLTLGKIKKADFYPEFSGEAMWEINNLSQLAGFANSFFFGCIFCVVYDIFRAVRAVAKQSTWAVFTEDIIYSLICAVAAFCLLLSVTGGELRVFVIFGLGCGFAAFRMTLSRFFLFVFKKVFSFVFKIILCIKSSLGLMYFKSERFFNAIVKKITSFKPKSKKNA